MMLIAGPFKYIVDKQGNATLTADLAGPPQTLKVPNEQRPLFVKFLTAVGAGQRILTMPAPEVDPAELANSSAAFDDV